MKKKHLKFLKSLLETPSPTGNEERAATLVRDRLSNVATEIRTDTMGSVHAVLEGTGQGPSCMLAAHMDEIGLMVTYISDEGFLYISSVGGVDPAILPGMRVDVHTKSGSLRGIVGRKPIHLIEPDERKSITPISKLVIDLGLPAKNVKELVRIGDTITFGVGFEQFGHKMAVSKAFDDKIGVFIACRVMEELAKVAERSASFTAAITVQEEIGTRGAITSTHAIEPDVALAFDVTHATDYPGIDKTKYGDIRCGKGPVIARGPNINPLVFQRLVAAAENLNIPYQLEAEPSITGTDARAIQVTRGGIPTGLISIPLRYMHTPTEVVCLSDVKNTVKLIVQFVLDLNGDACFVPGIAEPVEPEIQIVDEVEHAEEEPEYTREMKELIAMTEEAKALTQKIVGATGAIPGPNYTSENVADNAYLSNESDYSKARDLDNVTIEYASDAEVMQDTNACSPEGFPGGANNVDACMPEDESLRPEL